MPTAAGGQAISGHCDERFERVRDTMASLLARPHELGAAVCVVAGDQVVVDLWGGTADADTGLPWDRNTRCVLYSCTKALTTLVVAALHARGELDIRAPVVDVWPEFAAEGKARITVEQLLAHQAGLPALPVPVSVEEAHDAQRMADLLAETAPSWEPGTAHGYHALTYGWLVGEVIRRVTGRTVGEALRSILPPGSDLQLGGASPGPSIARMADPVRPPPDGRADEGGSRLRRALTESTSLAATALLNPPVLLAADHANTPAFLRHEWPAVSGVGSARSLAELFAGLARGQLLERTTMAEFVRERSRGDDRVLLQGSAFGLGFMVSSAVFPVPARTAFGHPGASGSVCLGDPAQGLGIGFVVNRLGSGVTADPRARRVVEAVYGSLDQ